MSWVLLVNAVYDSFASSSVSRPRSGRRRPGARTYRRKNPGTRAVRRKCIGPPRLSGRRSALRLDSTDPRHGRRRKLWNRGNPALQRELAGLFFRAAHRTSCASGKVQVVDTRYLERRSPGCAIVFYIDTEQAKGVQFAWRPATFDQEAFLLPPATRMLLATRRNPATGPWAATNLNSPNHLYPSEN